MAKVRESSPEGGFVKFDSDVGRWYEVGDRVAREKVSQTFRDALNDKYKSSTTSKTLKRRQERINRQSSVGSKESSSSSVASRPSQLPQERAIPAAQARLDSLIMAASSEGVNKPYLPPGLANLPRPSASSLAMSADPLAARTSSLLPARPGFGRPPPPMSYMTPSLAHLMATRSQGFSSNYRSLLLDRELEYRAQMRQSNFKSSKNDMESKPDP